MIAHEKVPLKRALLWIALSTLLVSGTATFVFFYYQHYTTQRKHDLKYAINAIVQSREGGPYLENGYLTELLGLSADQYVNLYQLRVPEATAKLNANPLIKKADIKKIRPGTLYIRYTSREPVAYLGDCTNTALDKEGVFFPYQPYYEEKPLPRVYVGCDEPQQWGERADNPKITLALKILRELKGHPIKLIDVSQAYAPSSGKRQIVIQYDNDLLRLKTEEYLTQINHYLMLRNKINGNQVVDLRIPQLAYIYDKEPLS